MFYKRCLALSLFWPLLVSMAISQEVSSSSSTVNGINLYAKRIDHFIARNPKRRRMFADVSSGTKDEASRWQGFKTKAAIDKADTGDNLNETAYVWLKGQQVVGVNFTLQSPSRDWAHFVMYYFREDGTLAKIRAQVNSFHGDFTLRREYFYRSDGKLLHTTARYFDLSSRKPIKPNKDLPEYPVPIYLKTQDLPFHKLL